MDTTVAIGPLTLKNPILTASGTFGFGLEFAPYGDLASLGGFVAKGLSLAPRQGNPTPRICETPCGMLNAIGIQNPGAAYFIRQILPSLPSKDTAVIANLYACTTEEFRDLAELLAAEPGVAALEVNVSCPNVSQGGAAFGRDPNMIAKVASAVAQVAGDKPVMVKLSPNVADVGECARAAVSGGADAVSLINTLTAMAVDPYARKPRLANVIGGLSGPAVKPVALRMVWEAAKAVNVPVIGVGGITTIEDVFEFILVGATAVQVGTANFMRPDTAFDLAAQVPDMMERLGISNLSEYRGTLIA